MTQNIQYSGIAAVPDPHSCPDGQLDLALNLLNEDGAVRPVSQPLQQFQLGQGCKPLALHESATFHNLIFLDDACSLCWQPVTESCTSINGQSQGIAFALTPGAEIKSAHPMGNLLIVSASDSLHYFIFRAGAYVYLGNHIPEISMTLSLEKVNPDSIPATTATVEYDMQLDDHDLVLKSSTLDAKKKYIDGVLSLKNAAVNFGYNTRQHPWSYFCLPFFVRYAVRLYDGTLVNHSAPVLIVPSGGLFDSMALTAKSHYKNSHNAVVIENTALSLVTTYHTLKYRLSMPQGNIADWKDLIQSVDIFFSRPIYTFNADPKTDDITLHVTANHANDEDTYCDHLYRTSSDILKEMEENASFYHVLSIEYEKLGALLTPGTPQSYFSTRPEWLENLAVREAMTDDFHTHDTYAANALFSYNSRLNIADISRRAFSGFAADKMLQFHSEERIADNGNISIWKAKKTDIYVELEFGDHTSGVVANYAPITSGASIQPLCRFSVHPNIGGSGISDVEGTPQYAWFYYPDRRAKRMLIRQFITAPDEIDRDTIGGIQPPDAVLENGTLHSVTALGATTVYHFEIPLKQHPFLNGAYALIPFSGITHQEGLTFPDAVPPATEHLPNMVYLSEVNNPFLFPASHAVPVGNGTIRGISSAIRPLSTGQFGAYPLYAFSTEGIWALDVAATGTYSARQPISREVCTDPSSITQLDASVVFRSDRGLMEISGSNVSCLTEILGHRSPFDITLLPHIDQITPLFGNDTFPLSPIPEFLQECSTIYDHQSARLILFNPLMSYAYVLSLKSQSWGMMQSSLAETFPCYPLTLALDRQGNVVRFDRDNAPTPPQGLLITRPLKLSQPGVHKTIDTLIQHGDFATGRVGTILYGSNDLRHWFLVRSSRDHRLRGFSGTGYKYFRIALLTNLDPDESIAEALVQFRPRLTNRPR